MSEQFTIKSGDERPEDSKILSAAEQVMRTKPINEESLSNSRVNIVDRGLHQNQG